jgi:hypothetical protein
MKALKQKTPLSIDGLSRRYGGVPVLYLEAETDRYIYAEIWFRDYQSKVEFTAVDDVRNHAGCKAVVAHVHYQREQGNPAWGLVDRDALMAHNHWDLVWETDDAAYEAAEPFGRYIKATRCWELENYLADGEALEAYSARTDQRSPRASDIVYQDLCKHCDALVPHAAYNAMAHQFENKQLGDGATNDHADRQAMDSHIQTKILSKDGREDRKQAYFDNLGKVDCFIAAYGEAPKRYDGLRRRIHGKALLSRWAKHNQWPGDIGWHIGHLAEEIARSKRIPEELRSFMDTISRRPLEIP